MNNSEKIKGSITTARDFLGVSALLMSATRFGLIEKLHYLSKNQGRSVSIDDLADHLKLDKYYLEPVLETLERIGMVKEQKGNYTLVNEAEFGYYSKMLDALPLYLELNKYFDRAKGEYEEIPFHFNRFITRASSRLADLAVDALIEHYESLGQEPVRILDIGCGIGDYLIKLASKNPTMVGTGIERDEPVARKCFERVRELGLDDRIQIVNGNFLEIASGALPEDFDFAMMNHIYHVVGPETSYLLTKQCYQHLKVGGSFFNLEICKDFPSNSELIPVLFDALMRFFYKDNKGKAFGREEIERIMAKSGFNIAVGEPIVITEFDTPNMVYFVGTK
jgi:SAM-dependent methyltransferase